MQLTVDTAFVHSPGSETAHFKRRAKDMIDDTQNILRQWLLKAAGKTGWSLTRLAKEAGVAQSTVTRLFSEDYVGTMTADSMAKLSRAAKLPIPVEIGTSPLDPGFREPELQPLTADEGENPNISRWTIKGNSLVLAGYMPGDTVWADARIAPRDGDIVIAQNYDMQRATAETVIRVYKAPFLMTAAIGADERKPIMADGHQAIILGTITRSERRRQ